MSKEAWGDEGEDNLGYSEDRVNEIGMVCFIKGAQMFREGLARYYDSIDPKLAAIIRGSWNDSWGDDPKAPGDEEYKICDNGFDPMRVA